VYCRIDEVKQVLLNLIVNAAHAVAEVKERDPGANGTITVSTAVAGDDVEIAVQDTGAGIPPAIRSRIFDPFFTTKRAGKGTGQGLAITRAVVVERHGGSVDVDSTPGFGATFTIRLPLVHPEAAGESEAKPAA
jgi:signal transduction histidine kinase